MQFKIYTSHNEVKTPHLYCTQLFLAAPYKVMRKYHCVLLHSELQVCLLTNIIFKGLVTIVEHYSRTGEVLLNHTTTLWLASHVEHTQYKTQILNVTQVLRSVARSSKHLVIIQSLINVVKSMSSLILSWDGIDD